MSGEQNPTHVYRIAWKKGQPASVYAEIVARRGNWYTLRHKSGQETKQQGLFPYTSSIPGAWMIEISALNGALRLAAMDGDKAQAKREHNRRDKALRAMWDEAFEMGELYGRLKAAKQEATNA